MSYSTLDLFSKDFRVHPSLGRTAALKSVFKGLKQSSPNSSFQPITKKQNVKCLWLKLPLECLRVNSLCTKPKKLLRNKQNELLKLEVLCWSFAHMNCGLWPAAPLRH